MKTKYTLSKYLVKLSLLSLSLSSFVNKAPDLVLILFGVGNFGEAIK